MAHDAPFLNKNPNQKVPIASPNKDLVGAIPMRALFSAATMASWSSSSRYEDLPAPPRALIAPCSDCTPMASDAAANAPHAIESNNASEVPQPQPQRGLRPQPRPRPRQPQQPQLTRLLPRTPLETLLSSFCVSAAALLSARSHEQPRGLFASGGRYA